MRHNTHYVKLLVLNALLLAPVTIYAQRIASGGYSSLGLCLDSTIMSFGCGAGLGNGPIPVEHADPQAVVTLTGVRSIAASQTASYAVKSDGTVWAWGTNVEGEVGNGTNTESYVPVQVTGIVDAIAVAGARGEGRAFAVRSNGAVVGWGEGFAGLLGNGVPGSSNVPVSVINVSGAVAVAAGSEHTLALLSNGTVKAWGKNYSGQLGNGVIGGPVVLTAVLVNGLSGVTAIAAGGSHSMALKSNGTVWTWGDGICLGTSSNNDSPVPVQVPSLSGIVAISAGFFHSLALRNDGTVWAWGGSGSGGILGNGSQNPSQLPIQVNVLTDVIAIDASGEQLNQSDHNLALKSDGTLWAWGHNSCSQLGSASPSWSTVPIEVSGMCEMFNGMQERNAQEILTVFPNPTEGLITLDRSTTASAILEIRNALGQEVWRTSFTGQRNTIDLRGQPAGTYSIILRTARTVTTQMVVLD